MKLINQDNWERSKERLTAFWQREIVDRPVIQVTAPRRHGYPYNWWRILDEKAQADPEAVICTMFEHWDNTYFAGDAYPTVYPNFGPGALTAFMGSPIHYDNDRGTSWQEHTAASLDDVVIPITPSGPLWETALDWNRRFVKLAPDRFIAGVIDLGMAADALAVLRGTENLCLDLLDQPERIKLLLKQLFNLWTNAYTALYQELPEGNGSNTWLTAWAPGRSFPLQNDFSCMISTAMYRELFLDDLQAYCDWLDFPVYHLDGPDAIKHLDMLLEIPSLKAIQWTAGAGQQPMPYWIPMLQRIQAAGKGVVIYIEPEELAPIMAGLRPEGVIVTLNAPDMATADALVASVSVWQ
jgi:hypothetical protein